MKEKFNKIRELAEEIGKSKVNGGGYIILATKDNEDGKSHEIISCTQGTHIDLLALIICAMKESDQLARLLREALLFSSIIPDEK